MAEVFGINSSHIINRKEIVLGFASHYFTPFLFTMLALLIPNTTAIHPITYTNLQKGILLHLITQLTFGHIIRIGNSKVALLLKNKFGEICSIGWHC